jgi:hypothetical protein
LGVVVGAAAVLAPSYAAAEIYGWVDGSGAVTYSNLPPPKNAKVIDVIEEAPPPSPQSQAAAQAAHQAEMRALNDKVQQLEREIQQTRWQATPPPTPYPTAAPPPPPYTEAPSYDTCDPEFLDCYLWSPQPVYSTAWFVPSFGFRGHRDHDGFHHGFHHFSPTGGPHFVGAPHWNGGVGASHGNGGGHAHSQSFRSAPMARAR